MIRVRLLLLNNSKGEKKLDDDGIFLHSIDVLPNSMVDFISGKRFVNFSNLHRSAVASRKNR